MNDNNPTFKKECELLKYNNLSKEEQQRYDAIRKRKWDNYAALKYAREEGVKEGIEEVCYEIVKNLLLKLDLPNKEIASLANVDLAFVEQVRKDLKL